LDKISGFKVSNRPEQSGTEMPRKPELSRRARFRLQLSVCSRGRWLAMSALARRHQARREDSMKAWMRALRPQVGMCQHHKEDLDMA